ncbi:MAG: mechanosensitive ion channel [Parabacteroides sp.]|nr:mechanosensitive ion channel [Parabacteroides sp.]
MKDDTDKFAHGLLSGIKQLLTSLGIDPHVVEQLDGLIYLVLILIIAFAVGKAVHWMVLYFITRIRKYKDLPILDVLIERKIIAKASRIIPPLLIIALLPFAFNNDPRFLAIAQKVTWIYFIVVLLISVNTMLSAFGETVICKNQALRDRPMKGVIQIVQVFFIFMAAIIIISVLVNKSPTNLITGLGAFAAVLMLIFRDSILGFVAGVLLAENDMIHIGDWIEMPSNGVNGIVMDITLNTVKVQNFDNTIVTIPPYSLISGSFTNWRGMMESGGRRIMRSYTIETVNIQAATEFLEEMKKFGILRNYIEQKQQEQAEGKVANTDNSAGLVNGTIETNLGLFRAYMTLYLQHHPFINQNLLLMVRTLPPNDNGIPLQVYCFSSNKNWPSYESIQSEIMEHFVSVLPEFGLYAYQNASSRDAINSAIIEGSGNIPDKMEQLYGIPWHTLKQPSSVADATARNTDDPETEAPDVSGPSNPAPTADRRAVSSAGNRSEANTQPSPSPAQKGAAPETQPASTGAGKQATPSTQQPVSPAEETAAGTQPASGTAGTNGKGSAAPGSSGQPAS